MNVSNLDYLDAYKLLQNISYLDTTIYIRNCNLINCAKPAIIHQQNFIKQAKMSLEFLHIGLSNTVVGEPLLQTRGLKICKRM